MHEKNTNDENDVIVEINLPTEVVEEFKSEHGEELSNDEATTRALRCYVGTMMNRAGLF